MSLTSQPAHSASATFSRSAGAGTGTITSKAGEDGNPTTPLISSKGKNGFMFPPIWSFPPFFTLQPNLTTQAHQVELWSKLVLDWARAERVFTVDVDAAGGDLGEVFENKAIKRRLAPPSIRTIIAAMIKEGRAAAEPPKQNDVFLVYWRKPEEWGTEIYDWVVGSGMAGSILTFWEITEGELTEGTEFYGLPPALLRKAIDTLVKKAKAQVIKGEGESGEGVRFFQ